VPAITGTESRRMGDNMKHYQDPAEIAPPQKSPREYIGSIRR
jgi:hypothetical protein